MSFLLSSHDAQQSAPPDGSQLRWLPSDERRQMSAAAGLFVAPPDCLPDTTSEADAAWVLLTVPLPPAALHAFLHDTERLLRLNPCLEFERLCRAPDGRWHLVGRNESNGQPVAAVVERVAGADGFVLRYDAGIKRETRFVVAPAAGGATLSITEVYATPAADEAEQRLAEVDRSLVPWAAALRRHLRRRARWGGVPGYAWGERFWLAMPPRQRRVARLIVWTTLLEFVVFVAVLAVYVAA